MGLHQAHDIEGIEYLCFGNCWLPNVSHDGIEDRTQNRFILWSRPKGGDEQIGRWRNDGIVFCHRDIISEIPAGTLES